jgi:glycosyltransferase involved in cell wall biosynthesis
VKAKRVLDKKNILVIAGLSNEKLISKVAPLLRLDDIDRVYVIRKQPIKYESIISYFPVKILRRNIILAEVWRLFAISYILLTKKVDIIMGIYFFPHGLIAGLFGFLNGKRIIQNLIGDDLPKVVGSEFCLKLLRKSKVVINRGENTRDILIKAGIPGRSIFQPPNVIEIEKLPLKTRNDSAAYDLIFVGGLVHVKRVDVLLNSVANVKYKFGLSNLRLAIVGDGVLRKKLCNTANDLRIRDNVIFLGYQSNIFPNLTESKVFIMTSDYEGLPMAMIEAMAVGLPCIVPNVGNITTVAKNNYNSFVVQPGDINGFSKAIHCLLTDDDCYNRIAKNVLITRERKFSKYSMENVVDIWRTILQTAISL